MPPALCSSRRPRLSGCNSARSPAPGLSIGYGLGIARFGDFIGHNGAIFGYSTAMFYLPDADATFVLEGNHASNFSNAATDIFLALAKHLFPERFGTSK